MQSANAPTGHQRQATALYLGLIDQLRDRIAFLGWPMWVCDEKSGLQDGYTAKLLNPDTPSGRVPRWDTLQLLIDALFPDGMAFLVVPRSPRRKPYRNNSRRLTLGLDKLPPHPASVRTIKRKDRPKEPRLRLVVSNPIHRPEMVNTTAPVSPQGNPLEMLAIRQQRAKCVGALA